MFVWYNSVPNEAGWRVLFTSKGEQLVEIGSDQALIIKQRHSGVGCIILRLHITQDFVKNFQLLCCHGREVWVELKAPLPISELGSDRAELGRREGKKRRESSHEPTIVKPEVIPEGNSLTSSELAFGSFHNQLYGCSETFLDRSIPTVRGPGYFLLTVSLCKPIITRRFFVL